MKLGIALNDELVNRIDSYASENYMSRSGFITLACTQFLNSVDSINVLKNLNFTLMNIADDHTITDEDREKLNQFEQYIKFLTQK